MSTPETKPHNLSTPEFVAMTAFLMALNALAIDVMIPAMSEIGEALGVQNENDAQLIIMSYMIGFGFSQLVWGPVTDSMGRKPVLMWVLVIYVITSLGCTFSKNFETLLMWRFLLGIGAGGTRVVAVSVVRDLYVGRGMAQIMSLVMTVFMVVPVIAPWIGQMILHIAPWQGTFGILALGGAVMFVWGGLRLPETRPKEKRTPFNFSSVADAYMTVLKTREALGYTLASGVIFGSLFAFISASEQIFNDVFHIPETFVYWFSVIAGALSLSNFTNSRIVMKLGQRRISHTAIIGFIVFSLILLGVVWTFGANLYVFIFLFAIVFMNFGFMGPNFNSMAMESLGRVAGTASALLGFASTTIAAVIGGFIARQYDHTLIPILLGYVGMGSATLIIVLITERGKLFSSN